MFEDDRLEREKLDALAEFAAGAGHEINNPLAIIGGHAQLLLKEVENEEHRRSLAIISAQVKRAYEMIADIRLFARPPVPEIVKFEPVPLLERIIEEQRKDAAPYNTDIELRCSYSKNQEIESDPVQVNVVISAIFKNAREAIRENGKITVHIDNTDDFVRIEIEDTGPGIPEDVRPLIFCPFYSARQAGRGLGFGLSKAWRIMQQLDGSISVENLEPNGAKFTLLLPNRPKT